jgi:N-methylhydantoinase A
MRVGVDIGGTFTDVTGIVGDRIVAAKVPTTPEDPSIGALNGIRALLEMTGCAPEDVDFLAHGTTVATNALIEHGGARTALVTTKGFRDVLEIGRLVKPSGHLYNIQYDRPAPIIPRRYRWELTERVTSDGSVLAELDHEEVDALIAELRDSGVESVAVAFLFSWLNPKNEQLVGDALRRGLPHVPVFLSSEVWPEIREYERTALTALNAYVGPLVNTYLERLASEASTLGVRVPFHIMQSNGGLASAHTVTARPALLALSGPAGGMASSREIGRQTDLPNLVTFDMGGTSTDVSVIAAGEFIRSTDRRVHELPIAFPMLDIEAIGAGGGSLAWIDGGGRLRVGPQSAGAVPGPACYGRGGTQPTVTDANVALGYLSPSNPLGGDLTVDVDLARESLESVGNQLTMSAVETALAVRRLVNVAMGNAVRLMTVARGRDLRDFGLVAYGGNGPVHAIDVADELGIERVVVPGFPGVLSALGVAVSDLVHDDIRTYRCLADAADPGSIEAHFAAMESKIHLVLDEDGVPSERREMQRFADVRYSGQGFSLTVDMPASVDPSRLDQALAAFHSLHQEAYGFHDVERPLEMVSLRVRGYGRSDAPSAASGASGSEPRPSVKRDVYFSADPISADIVTRDSLRAGDTISGPAVIEQMDSTLVVPPDWTGTVDAYDNLVFVRTAR